MAGKLEGKVAVVTGASSGIGEATALALGQEGARVALVARRADRLEQVAQRVTQAGGEALQIEADITDYAQVQRMIRTTQERWNRLDILINNAGVMLLGRIPGANIEDWQRMVNINLLGLLYATHEALPIMQRQGSGHIVNVSSVAGRVARAGSGVYNATKFAVGAFSEALRQEVTKQNHIRVTIIEPGMVATELREHITDAQAKQGAEEMATAMTQLESQDIADTIVYAVTRPDHVSINEMLIRPTDQER